MKICAHTMVTPTYDLYQAIASIGFDGVELIWTDDYRCAINAGISGSELSRLKKHAEDFDLQIAGLVPYIKDPVSKIYGSQMIIEGDGRSMD